jgi:two-component sensor histidine kinase
MSYTAYSLLIGNFFSLQDDMIDKLAKIDAGLSIYYLSLMVIFITMFTREFFNTTVFKKIDFSLKFGICVIILIAITSSFSEYILNISILSSLLFLSYIFLIGIYFIVKKVQNSGYFLIAWGVNLFGTILFLLFNMGVYVPENGNYNYFYELCIIFEAFLFSVILSKKLTKTKELAESVAIHKILVRELHHRIKNNLQFIVSMYRLKLRKFLDKEARAILGEAEQHILSISKIHEILYANKNLSSIDSKEYFLELLKEVQQSFAFDNIEIKIDATNEIDSNDAIYCGLIINELVTNAVKYAFKGKDGGVIEIDYRKENRLNILKIRDNGIGFEKSINPNSFGLALVAKLVELELHGKINFLNNNGAKYSITWLEIP